MQLELNGITDIETEKKVINRNVILTDRDFEILKFILEMKFSSSEEVFIKFFKITKSLADAKSDLWAKKRLLQLENSNFLKSVKVLGGLRKYYIPTLKAYFALSNFYTESKLCKPTHTIDFRTFHHDRLVLQARLTLEELRGINQFISERELKASGIITQHLTNQYIPDGIYLDSNNKKIALELEIAIKSKSRYRDKINKYVNVMRSEKTGLIFQKAHYLCAKESLKNYLVKETRIYGDLFKIETINEFLTQKKELI